MKPLISISLRTGRLLLLPLDRDDLERLQTGRPQMEDYLGLKRSGLEHSATLRREYRDAMRFWLDYARTHPADYAWGTNWEIVRTAENRSIGGMGFNGLPDADGRVTVGYAIDERYQGRGFATEALKALCRWAFEHPKLREISALTPAANRASQRVLQKNQFQPGRAFSLNGLQLLAWTKTKPQP